MQYVRFEQIITFVTVNSVLSLESNYSNVADVILKLLSIEPAGELTKVFYSHQNEATHNYLAEALCQRKVLT